MTKLIPGQVYQVRPGKTFMAHFYDCDLHEEEIFVALTGPVERSYHIISPDMDSHFYLIYCNGRVHRMHEHPLDINQRVHALT